MNYTGTWLFGAAWESASEGVKVLCKKTQQIATAPETFFAPQMTVTVANALLIEWAAPSIGFASRVLQQRIAGAPGLEVDFN